MWLSTCFSRWCISSLVCIHFLKIDFLAGIIIYFRHIDSAGGDKADTVTNNSLRVCIEVFWTVNSTQCKSELYIHDSPSPVQLSIYPVSSPPLLLVVSVFGVAAAVLVGISAVVSKLSSLFMSTSSVSSYDERRLFAWVSAELPLLEPSKRGSAFISLVIPSLVLLLLVLRSLGCTFELFLLEPLEPFFELFSFICESTHSLLCSDTPVVFSPLPFAGSSAIFDEALVVECFLCWFISTAASIFLSSKCKSAFDHKEDWNFLTFFKCSSVHVSTSK